MLHVSRAIVEADRATHAARNEWSSKWPERPGRAVLGRAGTGLAASGVSDISKILNNLQAKVIEKFSMLR